MWKDQALRKMWDVEKNIVKNVGRAGKGVGAVWCQKNFGAMALVEHLRSKVVTSRWCWEVLGASGALIQDGWSYKGVLLYLNTISPDLRERGCVCE